jgi:hypothetical protein
MNPSPKSEDLRAADQGREYRGIPRIRTLSREHSIEEQVPLRNLGRPHVPDEGVFETFFGGAGI